MPSDCELTVNMKECKIDVDKIRGETHFVIYVTQKCVTPTLSLFICFIQNRNASVLFQVPSSRIGECNDAGSPFHEITSFSGNRVATPFQSTDD